jgi:hypothetical protein
LQTQGVVADYHLAMLRPQVTKDDDGNDLPSVTDEVYTDDGISRVAEKRPVLDAWSVKLREIISDPAATELASCRPTAQSSQRCRKTRSHFGAEFCLPPKDPWEPVNRHLPPFMARQSAFKWQYAAKSPPLAAGLRKPTLGVRPASLGPENVPLSAAKMDMAGLATGSTRSRMTNTDLSQLQRLADAQPDVLLRPCSLEGGGPCMRAWLLRS